MNYMDFPDADDQYEPKGSVIICRSPAKCQWPHWKCAPSPDFVDFCRRFRATFSRALAGTHKISTEEGLQRGWCLVLSLGVSKCFCAGGVHLLCPSLKPYFWTRMVLSFEHPFAFKHPLPFWKIASWTFRCSFLPPVLAPQEQAPVTLWMSQGMSKCIGCSICSIHVTHQSECENVILRRPFVCSISLYLHPNWSAKKCCRKSFQKSISSWGHHFHGKYAGNPKVSPGTFSPATCHNWFENDLEIATFFFFTVRNTSTSTLYTYFYDSTWCKLVLAPKAANSCKFHTNKTSRFVDLTVDTMAAVRIDVSWHCLICYV